jgi:hypothetical protein
MTALGDSGLITFNLANAPENGAIGVFGLDAAGLDATVLGTNWTDGTDLTCHNKLPLHFLLLLNSA